MTQLRRRTRSAWTIAILGSVVAAGIASLTEPAVHGQTPREWRDYAGGPDSSRFVASTQITKANVSELRVAWTYPPGQTDFNPLVVRGVVYARGPKSTFVALDAETGKEIWTHDGIPGFAGRGQTASGESGRDTAQRAECSPSPAGGGRG